MLMGNLDEQANAATLDLKQPFSQRVLFELIDGIAVQHYE
jgi:hypothetical protein